MNIKAICINLLLILLCFSVQTDDNKESEAKKHVHAKKDEKCFICDPALREKGRLWCKEHARYEDRCWLCHPEVEDKKRSFCKEHSLYKMSVFFASPL